MRRRILAVLAVAGTVAAVLAAPTVGAAAETCVITPVKISAGCSGALIENSRSGRVALLVGGRRLDFANKNQVRAENCADRPVHRVTAAAYDAVPAGPDPLYAAQTRDVAVERITPTPAYRPNCRPLYRLDGRDPKIVFDAGFAPKDPVNGQYDLAAYVAHNQPSPFVSTTYDFTLYKQWKSPWEYVLDAPGGIDVNETIGYDHKYANQQEVAFPGGLATRFIMEACPVRQPERIVDTAHCVGNPHYAPWRNAA